MRLSPRELETRDLNIMHRSKSVKTSYIIATNLEQISFVENEAEIERISSD